jgi:glycerophosphoryl diester phosphodiesterase
MGVARRSVITLVTSLVTTVTLALALPGAAAAAPRVDVVAHRGASIEAPENTLAAIRRAVDRGTHRVEVDVRQTRDGVPVLLHDPSLARTTDVEERFPDREPWQVEQFTWAELRTLDAGSWFSPGFAGVRIPTLEQVLVVLARREVGLLLELKTPARYPDLGQRTVALLRAQPRWYADQLRLGRLGMHGWSRPAMQSLAALAPDLPVGVIGRPGPAALPRIAEWAEFLSPRHDTVGLPYTRAARAAGLRVFTWGARTAPEMRRTISKGSSGVITGDPRLLWQVLRQW